MHHKRGRSRNQRAGCKLCKPNKINGWNKRTKPGHTGFSNQKQWVLSEGDIKHDW